MAIYTTELCWIEAMLGSIRSPLLDQFFLLWRFVDTFGFSMILILTIWYCFNRKLGIRLIFIALLGAAVSKFLKGFFGLPRPCQLDPLIGLTCLNSPGFPSGAAQSAMLIAGITYLESRNRVLRVIAILFALCLSFSRVYLGVHFFTDILGGWAVGAVLLFVYAKIFPLCKRNWKSWVFLFPALLLFIAQAKVSRMFGYSLGLAIGLICYDRWIKERGQSWQVRLIQLGVVLFGLWGVFELMTFYPKGVMFFAIGAGFWLSFLVPYIFECFVAKRRS